MRDDHLDEAGIPILDLIGNIPTWLAIYIVISPAWFWGTSRVEWLQYVVPTLLFASLLAIINSVITSKASRISRSTVAKLDRKTFSRRYGWIFYGSSTLFGVAALLTTWIMTNEVLVPKLLHFNNGGPLFWMSYGLIPLSILLFIPTGLFLQSCIRLLAYTLGNQRWRDYLQNKVSYGLPLSNSSSLELPSLDRLQIMGSLLLAALVWAGTSMLVSNAGVYVYPDKVVQASWGHRVEIPIDQLAKIEVRTTHRCASTRGFSTPCTASNDCGPSSSSCYMTLNGHIRFYGVSNSITIDSYNSTFGLFGGSPAAFYTSASQKGVPVILQPLSNLELPALRNDIRSDADVSSTDGTLANFYGFKSEKDLLNLP